MDYNQILFAAFEVVVRAKGEKPIILDLREITVITDYFLVTSAKNSIHLKALADSVIKKLEAHNIAPQRIEGYQGTGWILLDYGFMVIHLLTKEEREFYRLEQLWHGAKILTPTTFLA